MSWISINEYTYSEDYEIVGLLVQDTSDPDNYYVTVGAWCHIAGRFDSWGDIVHDEVVTHFCELPEVDESLRHIS